MTLHRIHPRFRQFGTITGRLAGASGYSVHQQPKSEGYFRAWRARPGYKWISLDFKSVEDVMLTEMSRDPSLMKLYGPGAHPAQDAYLFTAAGLPIIGPKLRAEGYDPNNPTAETVAHVKKVCKKERAIGKKLKLSANYGAGPNKIRAELALDGVVLSLAEAVKLHSGYWELYKGVKELERDLVMEWERNGGYVLNGIGRPVGCHADMLKDLISRTIQSTAHDVQMLHIYLTREILGQEGVEFEWVVVDWHDQLIIEVRAEEAERTAEIMMTKVLGELNRRLQGLIPILGDAQIGDNLWEVK